MQKSSSFGARSSTSGKPGSRPIIAVDIDDVLAKHIEAFIQFSNENYDTKSELTDYLEQWSDYWDVAYEEVEKRAKGFHTEEIIGNFAVIEDAQSALTKLKEKHDLVVVTARPKHTINWTRVWLDKNFPNTFSSIHFVPIWDPGPKKTKGEICREIGADYLIDDLRRHCNLAAEIGIKAVLFARIGWRQPEKLRPGVVQVKNWQEVLEYFDGR